MTKRLKRLINRRVFDITIIYLLTFIIYVHNLSPSSYGGDSGDIISAIVTSGVPHPSGYPLVTLLGIIFYKYLPVVAPPAWKMGVITSAFFSSLSITFMYLLVRELTKERFISIATALTLAFTFPFWLYAEVVEVMAMYYFFIIVLIYTTVRYTNSLNKKYLFWTAFLFGLSLTNNESIVLILPGIGLTILASNKKLLVDIKTMIKCLLLVVLGLIPYSYIPFAAFRNPPINTGLAITLKNFVYLITRHYYGWGINSIPQPRILFLPTLKAFLGYYLIYLDTSILIFSLLGFLYLLKTKAYKLTTLFLFCIILLGPFYFYYSNIAFSNFGNFASFEKFFTPPIIISFLFFPFGILFLKTISKILIKNKYLYKIAQFSILVIIIAFPTVAFRQNFNKTNLENIYIGDNFGKDAIINIEKNSVVLLQDDTLAYNVNYIQNGLKVRPDVVAPSLANGFDIILKASGLSEEQIKKYKIDHQNSLGDTKIFHSSLSNLIQGNTIYADWTENIVSNKYGKLLFVPYGLLFQVTYDKDFNLTEDEYLTKLEKMTKGYQIDSLIRDDKLISDHLFLTHIRRVYSTRYLEVARFILERYNDKNISVSYSQKAFEIDPYLEFELQTKKTP